MFRITIDQIPSGGGKMQRYGPFEPYEQELYLAVDAALREYKVDSVTEGHYQITVTDTNMESYGN